MQQYRIRCIMQFMVIQRLKGPIHDIAVNTDESDVGGKLHIILSNRVYMFDPKSNFTAF